MSAKQDPSLFHIPEAGYELCYGRFPAAGRSDEGSHGTFRDGQGYVVEDLLVPVVAERDVRYPNFCGIHMYRRHSVMLFFPVQYGIDLIYGCSHFRQTVNKIHSSQKRACDPKGKDDCGEKDIHSKRSGLIHDPSYGKNGDHRSRSDGFGNRYGELTALHPVIEICCISQHPVRKSGIRIFPLIECLDHFNPIDILYNG